jgi:3-phenylpropionate/trans-cinnamate dioxygenase ferredoxin reductase component
MHVNMWDVIEDLKAVVASGATVDPRRLADCDIELADLVADGSTPDAMSVRPH